MAQIVTQIQPLCKDCRSGRNTAGAGFGVKYHARINSGMRFSSFSQQLFPCCKEGQISIHMLDLWLHSMTSDVFSNLNDSKAGLYGGLLTA